MNKVLSTKTFIVSHIIILAVSFIFLGGLYWVLYSDQFINSPLRAYMPVTQKPVSFSLDVSNPDDELLVFDKSQVISGRTSPRSNVIISMTNSNVGIQADGKGEFSKVIVLKPGVNEITVAAFDTEGNSKSIFRTLYYSEEKI